MVGLTGFGALSQGLVGMTHQRQQTFWLIAASVTMALLSWLATGDPGNAMGVISKKFFGN